MTALGFTLLLITLPFRFWIWDGASVNAEAPSFSALKELVDETTVRVFRTDIGYEVFCAVGFLSPLLIWVVFDIRVRVLRKHLRRLGYDWVSLPDLGKVCLYRGFGWSPQLPDGAAFDADVHRPRQAEELPRFARAAKNVARQNG